MAQNKGTVIFAGGKRPRGKSLAKNMGIRLGLVRGCGPGAITSATGVYLTYPESLLPTAPIVQGQSETPEGVRVRFASKRQHQRECQISTAAEL